MKSICSLGAQICFVLFWEYQKLENEELENNHKQILLATSQQTNFDL